MDENNVTVDPQIIEADWNFYAFTICKTQPLFLGVNLLSREGYSQAGDRMRSSMVERHSSSFTSCMEEITRHIVLAFWILLSYISVSFLVGF